MITLDDISTAVIVLIRAGAVFRLIYCMVRLQDVYKRQARSMGSTYSMIWHPAQFP